MNRSSLGSSSPQRGAAPQPPYPGSCLPPRAVAPDTPPPPPDEKCGGRLEGLLAQADEILLKAEYDTYTPDRLSTRTETDGGIGPGSRPRMEDGSAGPKPRTEDGSPTMSERLLSLYAIEAGKETRSSHLKLASNLLDRLMTTSPFSRLVLTLNQQDGYVLGLMSSSLVYSELVKFSYQDTHLLNSIDNEEIPVIIADLLQDLSQNLFHGGCIVCEVRDHRGGGGGPWGGSRFVLLRPTTQSIICDSVRLGKEGLGRVNSEDRNSIESQIVMATEKPLCLDPSPLVGVLASKADHSRLKFNTFSMRRHAHKHYSQAGQSRKRKLESLPAPPELKIYDFIKNLNTTRLPQPSKRWVPPVQSLRQHQERSIALAQDAEAVLAGRCPPPSCVTGSLHLASPELRLAMPAQVDVEKFVRPLNRRPESIDMTPQLVEEYILETAERGQPRVYHTRLTILQRLANDEYIGELYVERDYKEEEKKGSTCRFQLGTRTNALKYINQFTEIFTEEGRKSVEITHKVPGQAPRVTYTPGLKASMAAAQAQQNAAAQSLKLAAPGQQQVSQPAGSTQVVVQAGQQASILQRKITPQSATHLSITSQGGINVIKSGAGGTITVSSGSLNEASVSNSTPVLSVTPNKNQINSILASKISRQIVQTPHGPQLIQTINQGIPKLSTSQPVQIQQLAQVSTAKLSSASGQASANGDNQQEAISAIVQSLMSAEAQFEQQRIDDKRKVPGQASGAAQLLPTVPVPASSLVGQRLPTGRVTLQNLRSIPLQQQMVKVTLSQLAAQLARPVQTSSSLPSYSQAIASQTNPALQSSPRKLGSGDGAPSLQALLSEDKSSSVSIASASNTTLLERLMAGGSNPVSLSSPNLNPLASQIPNVVAQQPGVNGSNSDSNDITLAGLLSNPPRSAGTNNSPTKMSPLLQQLQQPVVQSVHSRLYQTGLTSPKQPPASPRTNVTSPRSIQPAQSPRSVLPGSPRQSNPVVHQQLMQPPAPRYPTPTTHSILSAQLSQPPRSSNVSLLQNSQGLMAVTSQGLVPVSNQQNLVQVSQGQILHVSQPGMGSQILHVSQSGVLQNQSQMLQVQQASQSPILQLQQQQQNQPTMVSVSLQDLVNSGNNAVNGTMSQGGIVTLGQVGQVQLQSIPVQLSIPGHNQPITFSVSLPEGHQQGLGQVTNGSVNQQMIVNNTAKPGSVTVSSVGKLVNGPAGSGTVMLQGPSGNIIHLPAQAAQPGSQFTSIKPAPMVQSNMSMVRGGHQVMVRPGQSNSLLVQMPGGVSQQPIQIVSRVPVNQQMNCGTLVQAVPSQVKGLGASPSPQGPPTPHTPGIPSSPLSVTSPQGMMGPESPMVVQLQNHGEHHFVLSSPKQGGLVGQPLAAGQIINNQTLNSQTHLKMRQQRKQSLK